MLTVRELLSQLSTMVRNSPQALDAVIYVCDADPPGDFDNTGFHVVKVSRDLGPDPGVVFVHVDGLASGLEAQQPPAPHRPDPDFQIGEIVKVEDPTLHGLGFDPDLQYRVTNVSWLVPPPRGHYVYALTTTAGGFTVYQPERNLLYVEDQQAGKQESSDG